MATAPTTEQGSYREWTIWVIPSPRLSAHGLSLEWEGDTHEVAWEEIDRAFAAEVGEPEGIRAVVFDLVWKSAPDGPVVLRFSFDPSDGPKHAGQRVVESLGESSCSPSLCSLARDGRATELFSHVDLLDDYLLGRLSASA